VSITTARENPSSLSFCSLEVEFFNVLHLLVSRGAKQEPAGNNAGKAPEFSRMINRGE
jgi:hypothetical protein